MYVMKILNNQPLRERLNPAVGADFEYRKNACIFQE
jgi:hypothetical protein